MQHIQDIVEKRLDEIKKKRGEVLTASGSTTNEKKSNV